MAIRSSSFQSFKELSAQAQTLIFLYALAAWARHHAEIPSPMMLSKELENFWCAQQLCADELSDPNRMTRLLEKHFESVRSDAGRRSATKSMTCRSRVSA